MLRSVISLILLLVLWLPTRSQTQPLPGVPENGSTLDVLYRKDQSGKIYASTRGYGALYRYGRHVTSKTRSFFEVDLQLLKHPKEIKTQGQADVRRRFVFGKLNQVFLLRAAVGAQNVLFSKADLKAVEIRYSYSIGPSVAFAKPYYYQINRISGSRETELVKFNTENYYPDSTFVGRGSYLDGLGEMKFYPAVTAKFNLSFEYAPFTDIIRAIETGVTVDYFPKALPLMAFNPAENFIVTLHVGFVFGRKWY